MKYFETDNFKGLDDRQIELIGALIGLAKSCENNEFYDTTIDIIIHSLYSLEDQVLLEKEDLLQKVRDEKDRVVPNCKYCASPCGNTSAYDLKELLSQPLAIQKAKMEILQKLTLLSARLQDKENPRKDSDLSFLYLKSLAYLGLDLDLSFIKELLDELDSELGNQIA